MCGAIRSHCVGSIRCKTIPTISDQHTGSDVSFSLYVVKASPKQTMLCECKNLLSISLLLVSVIASVKAGDFDAKKHVSYEMSCRFSNESSSPLIDTSILRNENLVVNGQGDSRTVSSLINCRLNWNPNRPTRLFIHGYYSDHNTLKKYATAYLARDDYNFIAINWLHGAQTVNYVKARYRILEVGKAVARFIEYLVTLGLDLDDLTCVGHSLGV